MDSPASGLCTSTNDQPENAAAISLNLLTYFLLREKCAVIFKEPRATRRNRYFQKIFLLLNIRNTERRNKSLSIQTLGHGSTKYNSGGK